MDVTFLAIAMLVLGGLGSLTGAVVGAVGLSFVSQTLGRLENGQGIWLVHVKLPNGTTASVVAALLLLTLILLPRGLTGGRELAIPRRWRRADRPPQLPHPAPPQQASSTGARDGLLATPSNAVAAKTRHGGRA
jgi:branched-chain amino acid transport system permease protein